MNFDALAGALQELEQESSRLKMTQLLSTLFTNAQPTEAGIIANLCTGQLQPSYKMVIFGLAEKSMIKVVARVLGCGDNDVAERLKKAGDLGLVVAAGTWQVSKKLSLEVVYEQLNDIAQLSGTGSQEAKIDALAQLLQRVEPLSAKFIVRIVLNTLRLGFSDMTIIDALSWMLAGDKSLSEPIEDAFNVCADIGLIALVAKRDGIAGIKAMKVVVGIPIRPAAAERLPSAQAIIAKLGSCVAEPKLDGFRLQVHISVEHGHPKVAFFSRNLTDMSAMYPDLVKALAPLAVKNVIFEGEAIAFDRNTGAFMKFQETVKRKRKHDVETAAEHMPLQLFLFDILYLDDKSLMGLPLEKRRAELEHLIKKSPVDHEIIRVDAQVAIKDATHLEEYFLAQVNAGLEGVVVKRTDAIYQPGKRNFNWIKLKRLEAGHLLDTIDCVVLGYYAGQGKRAEFGIGAILVGVYHEKFDAFQTLAKIGTGISDDGWRELKHKCDVLKVDHKPKNVECHKDLYPDVWVVPSLVIEVKADEITQSPLHSAAQTEHALGLALRFPRFVRYRDDKNAVEITTAHEVREFYEQQKNN